MKLKIIAPIIILALLFTLITGSLFTNRYQEQNALLKLKYELMLATKISQLTHALQKERSLSIEFNTHKEFNKNILDTQYIQTNKTIQNLNQFLEENNKENFHLTILNNLDKTLENMEDINDIRTLIDKKNIPIKYILSYYSEINKSLLNIIFQISKYSKIPIITHELIAYSHFLYLKEYVSIEKALGIKLINSDIMSLENKLNFHNLLIKEEMHKELFFKYASQDTLNYCHQYFKNSSITKVKQLRNKILATIKNNKIAINMDSWLFNVSAQIDILTNINNYLANQIIINIQKEYEIIENNLFIFTLLSLLSIVVFISMIIAMVRLIQQEKNLQKLIDKYVITSTTDLKGNITNVSQAFSDISGYSKSELMGKPHNIVRDPSMPKKIFKEMWHTIQNNETWYGNIKNRNKDGSFYWVYAIISPIYSYGKKIGYSAIRQDITSKKEILELNSQLEEKISIEVEKNRQKDKQLIEQSRLAQMGEMLSMIAHQWRQPLNAISFSSSGLELKAQLGKADPELILELSKNISNNVQYLSRTIDDFKDFFKQQKDKEEISFTQVIEKTLNIISPSIVSKNIEIIKNFTTDQKFYTYHNELQQVILNILQNAEDILTDKNIEKPYIRISTSLKDNEYILEIEDNGGGVKVEDLTKIFNPYFSTKLEKEGTGLGLYMSKMIIEDHCLGKLNVKNSSNGAIFQIKLQTLEDTQ